MESAGELNLDLLLLDLKYELLLPAFLKALMHFEPNPVYELSHS